MGEVIEGLDATRIAALLERERFFWLDVTFTDGTRDELRSVLGLHDHALDPLLDFREDVGPSHKFHVDGEHVVFKFSCFLELDEERDEDMPYRLHAMEVHVLVCGGYLLTVHRERVSLSAEL